MTGRRLSLPRPPQLSASARSAVVWAVAAAIVVFCAFAGWSYREARTDESLAYAKARDAVLADGRRNIARLNSIDGTDAQHVQEGLRQWLDATTGPLHDEVARTNAQSGTSLQRAGTSARCTVTDAAVTELDTRSGTARLIATVRVALTPRGGAPTTDRKRFEAGLARTSGGWRLTAINAVPVGAG
ncbi:hypothetical protein ABZ721_30090 [Streptomyces sp. NPDC006733]|uniref:hypothetical protein n=1 Tax=Streptomyces sp. NPDC006733 TaxID=3155460 RepID=UPI0034072C58